jgi:predicted RNA binding protein YcfA (HicA-like mRNA interferase family)
MRAAQGADMIKMVEADGWYQVSQRGSHRQYKHPTLDYRGWPREVERHRCTR